MIFERIQTEGIAELSCLVGDDSEGVAAVIDPWPDVLVYLEVLDGLGGLPIEPGGQTEEVDRQLPALREMNPDVVIVTGDHSTPAAMRSHSWHPVPTILWSENVRPDNVTTFGERDCTGGSLGSRSPTTDLIPLALAHAGRLKKFGA